MSESAGARFERLVQIMRTLRGPDGCAWDREQTLASLRPFVLEEAYELVDAIDSGDMAALREELGDFLFEAVFLAQIADEAGAFSVGDAADAIAAKLVSRHPHVFTPDGAPLAEGPARLTPVEVKRQWEDLKAAERSAAGRPEQTTLSGIPRALPALQRAHQLGIRAARVGFDWVQAGDVLDKIDEEVGELREAIRSRGAGSAEAEDEFGDLLFALANLSRKLGIDPEAALRQANDKFQRRFEAMERRVVADGRQLRDMTAAELDSAWSAVKNATTEHTEDTETHGGKAGKTS
jgi:MazG family protein